MRAACAWLLAALALALAGLSAPAAVHGSEVARSAEEGLFESLAVKVQDEIDAGRIPGAVVVIGGADRIAYRRAFGDRSLAPARSPMSEDTIFDLASLTKVVATTTAVMQLVERGRLQLDEPVARYWPEFAANGKGRISVRQLLTHYSGLRADLDLSHPWTGYSSSMELIVAQRPVSPPGSAYLYSDINFEILGELVRRISGLPLDVYCDRFIFSPLGMDDTSFRVPAPRLGRVAPTAYRRGRVLQGEVHDPTAYRMGGIAGHAGLFSTADDLARFAQMLLRGGDAGGRRILEASTVDRMTSPQSPPGQARRRGLGWDLDVTVAGDPADAPRRPLFGHTGFTGTSLWLDPVAGTFVILLSNRLHPDDRGDVRPLRASVGKAFADWSRSGWLDREPSAGAAVRSGADVLAADDFAPLRGQRIGLITNHTGLDSRGRRTIDLLRAAGGVELAALFSPEHGLAGDVDSPVASGTEPSTGLPVYSLYGSGKRPTDAMIDGLDALVFDIQDAGVRFYTYITTMAYAMEAAARKGIAFYVLDRPNPISAAVVQGPVLDADLRSFTGYFPLPLRHGMTVGELARMFNAEGRIGARLSVVSMHGYRRSMWYDETGLAWVGPSPNLRTLTQATLYPAVGMVEGANVSVGRGTPTPFELLGAPWIDGRALAAYLNRRAIAGARFEAVDFTPDASRYANRLCHGVRLVVTDRLALDAAALGLELQSALYRLHPAHFEIDKNLSLIGAREVLSAIKAGDDPAAIAQRWQVPLQAFLGVRGKYLLYEE